MTYLTINIEAAEVNGNLNDTRVISVVVAVRNGKAVNILSRTYKSVETQGGDFEVNLDFVNEYGADAITAALSTEAAAF